MVTFAYFLSGTLLLVLTVSFDLLLFHYSIMEALQHLLVTDIATGRYIVLIAATMGLVWALVTDYRLHKNKSLKKSK